jgi:SAM-dependent methyltransferase/uncharacterized protein YbaR (Trm112 family)
MRQRLASLLVCPLDRTGLDLVGWDVRTRPLDRETRSLAAVMKIDPASLEADVETGLLLNHARRLAYPIYRGVPRMLVFRSGLSADFEREFGDRLAREWPGYRLPSEGSMPGEADVLRSFSQEWLDYDFGQGRYWNMTPERLYRCMDFMLDLEERPVRHGRVIEVGIGIGGIADHVSRSQACEVVGVDLSHAVDAAERHFGANPLLHVVQASVFALPFADGSFDLAYSHGVIHHTYSTRDAFQCMSRLPRHGGRLYVWVYSPLDERRTLTRRALMALEHVLRPICWRLPTGLQTLVLVPLVPLYMAHQAVGADGGAHGTVRYGFNEALHAARDRFTPRYVHRHDDDEVGEWFRAAGFRDIRHVRRRTLPAYLPASFVYCTGVDGVRQ